jgi:hypothetical protein
MGIGRSRAKTEVPVTDTIIKGRAAIAAALGRSEKTISRWIRSGILAVRRAGPYPNSMLMAHAEGVARARRSVRRNLQIVARIVARR